VRGGIKERSTTALPRVGLTEIPFTIERKEDYNCISKGGKIWKNKESSATRSPGREGKGSF